MTLQLPVTIAPDVAPHLIQFCNAHHLDRFTLVADQNTYAALGRTVEEALAARGFDVKTIILAGDEIIADEHFLVQVFLHADGEERTYLAVGSGTITDIVRFVSHRTRCSFISLPTAPSVDGFTSIGAPLVIGGVKQTVNCQPPAAVFADLHTLCAAPRAMIAAGLGDMLGKFTSLADWKLGALVRDEPYNKAIAQRAWRAVQDCAAHVDEIGRASREGIRHLMKALIESGLCMLEFGATDLASGAEHHLSHFWEMKLLREGRPAILHGAKVGVGCILVAGYYEKVRQLTREQAAERLRATTLPDREDEIQRIRAGYGPIADHIIATQAPFLNMPAGDFESLKQRVIDRWPDIQDVAARVPTSQQLAGWLRAVDGPIDAQSLGLSDQDVALALQYSHYLRSRFTVARLSRLLGLTDNRRS